MPSVDFKRVRAEVTEFWSGEPINDPDLVQRMIEWHSSFDFPYPDVKAVEPARGVWDIYLPEDVVQEFDKRSVEEFELEAVERYFRVRFLGER
jgi:hypothetical protein